MTRFRPCSPSHQKENQGQLHPCERGFECRLEVLGEATRAVDPTERSFNDPTFWQHYEAFDLCVGAFDDGDGNAARFEGRALRFIALITRVNKGHCYPRAFAMHGFE